MNKLPRKLTTVGAGIGGILAVIKICETQLAYVAIVGIILLCLSNMTLQYLCDNHPHPKGEINGKVHEESKDVPNAGPA